MATKHPSDSPEYKAWQTMKSRCLNPEHTAYKNYGGRGIGICERWLDSVENFLVDMGPKPTTSHELDREDNTKGYSPENCRWVTRRVNARNRRSNRIVTYKGERMTVIEASELSGVSATTAWHRLDLGWTEEAAFESPVRRKAANGCAQRPPPMSNKHGLKGVKLDTKTGKYYGRRMVLGRRKQTRKFHTPEEAHVAYLQLGAQASESQ